MIKIFDKNKLFLLVLIILLIMSSGIIEAQNEEEVFENLKFPSNIKELVQSFSYMSYNVVVLNEDQKRQDSTIVYEYLGKEAVDNVETDKVSFQITDRLNDDMPSNMLFWFGETDIKKMGVEGEIISDKRTKEMGQRLLGVVFSPIYILSNYDIKELRKVGEISHSMEEFREENIDVTTIKVENIPEFGIKSGTIKLAQYDEMSFVISFSYVSSKEDVEINFDINDIEFH